MKRIFFVSPLLMAVVCGFAAACSSDDDEPALPGTAEGGGTARPATEIFVNGLPGTVGGRSINVDEKGMVTSIVEPGRTVTFSYGPTARAADFDGSMTIVETGDEDNKTTLYFKLNKKGFVSYALEVYDGRNDADEWRFSYNSDGHLTQLKRTDGNNEVTTITWTDGNISKVSVTDDYSSRPETYAVSYGEAANKGCIMLFDWTLGIDMDEMEAAHYAGLLGRPTDKLPVKITSGGDEETFLWTLDSNGFPTKLVSGYNGLYDEVITFGW